MSDRHARAAVFAAVLVVGGCGGSRGGKPPASPAAATSPAPVTSTTVAVATSSSAATPAPGAANTPPSIVFPASLAGTWRGDIPVEWDAVDLESDRIAVTVEHSTDAGATWRTSSRGKGSGPVIDLASSPGGTRHTFVWDSLADLGPVKATAVLRFTPRDRVAGPAALLKAFAVDGTAVSTTPARPSITALRPTYAARRGTVVIEGTRFGTTAAANQVSFGGVAATVAQVLSNGDVVVSVPQGAPLGLVAVTVTAGGLASTPVPFTVEADPVVLSVSPNPASAGSKVTITGDNFDTRANGVVVRFPGGVSAIGTAASKTAIVVTVPAGAQSGGVVVVTNGAVSNAVSLSIGAVASTPAPPAPTPTPTPAPTNTPPAVRPTTPASPASGAVTVTYVLTDAQADRADVTVEYTWNNGASWFPARNTAASDPVSGLPASPGGTSWRFVWNSTADLGAVDYPSVRLRFTARDATGTGPTVETGSFALRNAAPASGTGALSIASITPNRCKNLSPVAVTVKGSGFDAQTVVRIGNNKLRNQVVVDSTTITGLPERVAWTGLCDVEVTSGTGKTFRLANGFTYLP